MQIFRPPDSLSAGTCIVDIFIAISPPVHSYVMSDAPLPSLKKLTTSYSSDEDRFVVRAQVQAQPDDAKGEILVLHLTQRLLLMFLPHLFDWIAGDETAWLDEGEEMTAEAFHAAHLTQHLIQGAAQGAVAVTRPRPAPVVARPGQAILLVTRIDLHRTPDILRLTLYREVQPTAIIDLSRPAARQWLDILWTHWHRNDWPLHLWPDWAMREST